MSNETRNSEYTKDLSNSLVTSEQIKKRVEAAREIQKQRFKNEKITINSQMNTK